MCETDTLVPKLGVITEIRNETQDVKTFSVKAIEGGSFFEYLPGQCAMLSVPGVGEAMFSISSSPDNPDFLDFSIKKTGVLTDWLHTVESGQQITVRGPYGKSFPVEDELKGQDILFVAGGIGLAPLRSVIKYVLAHRNNYGSIDIVYGARAAEDLVFLSEIKTLWEGHKNVNVHLTIDNEQENWDGYVGYVSDYVKMLKFSPDRITLVCGPPIMIKLVLKTLLKMGFDTKKIYTTMEMRMKCGVGKCGRCNIGAKYVCKDGPVFRCDELVELPEEY